MSEECFNCGGRGIVGGCPICGKELDTVLYKKIDEEAIDNSIRIVIPKDYQKVWDSSILVRSNPQLEDNKLFKIYIDGLNKVAGVFEKRLLPKNSLLITSNAGMGKTTIAYYCMARALEAGYTVPPIIDNVEYRRINNLSTDVYLYKNYLRENPGLPTIEEITNADFVVMKIDTACFKDSHRDIQSLLDKRSRKGKITMFISNLSMEQIMFTDSQRELAKYTNNTLLVQPKQLRVINFFRKD